SIADKGWIERDPSRSRGLRLLGVDLSADAVRVPCYDGIQAEGEPLDRRHHVRDLTLDRRLAGGGDAFIVEMRGESMRDAGILDGDSLLVEPVEAGDLTDGDLVLSRIGGRALVKRYIR